MNTRSIFRTPELSPERQALAVLIERKAAHLAEIAATSAALERAKEAVWNARQRHEDATPAVAAALAAATVHAVSLAAGRIPEGTPPPPTVRQARDALADAADELVVAHEVARAIEAQLEPLTRSALGLDQRVREATTDVLRSAPEVVALVDRVERLQDELADLGGALMALVDLGAVPGRRIDPTIWARTEAVREATFGPTPTGVGGIAGRLQSPPVTWDGPKTTETAWRSAVAVLASSAGALLPK